MPLTGSCGRHTVYTVMVEDKLDKPSAPKSAVQRLARKSERVIIMLLICMMALVLVLATIGLGYEIVMSILTPPFLLLDFNDLLDLFGVFMLVLIGIELLDTIKVYFNENVVHVEVVLLVAMIAVARKVIVLEPEEYDPVSLIGIAALILGLAVGYHMIKQAMDRHGASGAKGSGRPA